MALTSRHSRYVLATAAYNEEAYIGATVRSVVAQTLPPVRWVIVSDGSTDRTDRIVEEYAQAFSFIRLYRVVNEHPRDFAAQVHAINRGFDEMRDLEYEFIGNLDADITLESDYFERLLRKFCENSELGLAGGWICENKGGKFKPRRTNSIHSVPHAVQLFRRETMQCLGGYLSLPYGGPDWHAEVSVRMQGWRVRAFPDLKVFHHRPTGSAGGLLRYWFRQGRMDYSLGTHPAFECVKLVMRLRERPFVVGALARLAGFMVAPCCREVRSVPRKFISFLRSEQLARLRLFRRWRRHS